jgi:MFS family permease
LGISVAGIVPIILPLTVHGAGGAAQTGVVIAALNLGGLTAPVWGGLADRYRLHRCLALGGVLMTALALGVILASALPVIDHHQHTLPPLDAGRLADGDAS